MQNYNLSEALDRNEFTAIASKLTGMTPGSVSATMKIERNRKPSGAFASGLRYHLVAKRAGVRIVAPRKTEH